MEPPFQHVIWDGLEKHAGQRAQLGLNYQRDKGLSSAKVIEKIDFMSIYNPGVAEYITSDAGLRLLASRNNPPEAGRFLIGYNWGGC
jgi:hypothetical protein